MVAASLIAVFPTGGSGRHFQGQLVQIHRGEEVSDALILSQAQVVLRPFQREPRGRSEGDKALLLFRRGL